MRFTLLSHGVPVGSAALDTYDEALQAARGAFVPTPAWARVLAAAPEPRWPAPRGELLAALAARRAALGFTLVDAHDQTVATALIEVEAPSPTSFELTLVVCPARPDEWLAQYGAPYRADPGASG